MTTTPLPEPALHTVEDNDGESVYPAYYTADQLRAYAAQREAAAVAAERERIKADLLRRHEASKDRHNYHLCLARELFGDTSAAQGAGSGWRWSITAGAFESETDMDAVPDAAIRATPEST